MDYINNESLSNKVVVIFGTGKLGEKWNETLKKIGVNVDHFSDNNEKKWSTIFCGKKVLSLSELYKLDRGTTIIIIASQSAQVIFEQLRIAQFESYIACYKNQMTEQCNLLLEEFSTNHLFNKNKVEQLYSVLLKNVIVIEQKDVYEECIFNYFGNSVNTKKYIIDINNILQYVEQMQNMYEILEDQKSKRVIYNILKYKIIKEKSLLEEIFDPMPYFLTDIFEYSKEEVLIDGGAYVGDTVKQFIEFTKNQFKKIYSFEANKYIYEGTKQLFLEYEDIKVINKGIYNKECINAFEDSGTGSRISEKGSEVIETIVLDDFIKEKVTFIKFDIEGCELEGLQGCKNIIKKDKPKLAICIYHRPEDLWKLPLYIKTLLPEYKIYIRQHRNYEITETVCYATI